MEGKEEKGKNNRPGKRGKERFFNAE